LLLARSRNRTKSTMGATRRWLAFVVVLMVAITAAVSGDPDAVVDEYSNYQTAPAYWTNKLSQENLADMLVQKDGHELLENAMAGTEDQSAPVVELLQAPVDSDDSTLMSINGKTKLEKIEALADARVKEDRADMLLSADAQDLQHIKGQMTLQVLRAKQLLAKKSKKGATSAKLAAALATKLLAKTHVVKADQAKEKTRKLTLRKVEALVSESGASEDVDANDMEDSDVEDTNKDDETRMPPSSEDPISVQLLKEANKYKKLQVESSGAVKAEQDQVASLQTTVQTLMDKLVKAKSDLFSTSKLLKQNLGKNDITRKMYQRVTSKEHHHKKTVALERQIRAQEIALQAQKLRMENSKEQLHKSLNQKAELRESPHAKHTLKKVTKSKKGTGVSSAPALSAAVDAVSSKLRSKDIEAQLRPQVAELKKTLKGAKLKAAIDKLVSETVSKKVNSAMSNDPEVSNAVRTAVGKARANNPNKAKTKAFTPSAAQEESQLTLSKVNDADEALSDISSRLDAAERGDPGQDLMVGLEEALSAV